MRPHGRVVVEEATKERAYHLAKAPHSRDERHGKRLTCCRHKFRQPGLGHADDTIEASHQKSLPKTTVKLGASANTNWKTQQLSSPSSMTTRRPHIVGQDPQREAGQHSANHECRYDKPSKEAHLARIVRQSIVQD